ncbi:hypothetical protein LINPERPRIM_LOCUS37300 [Linum perenne]
MAKLGEVLKIGYFDASTPEGSFVKGRVRMDLLDSFLGTAPVTRPNGTSFPVYFQYIGVPCICFLCGFLGHVMADCSRTDVVFDVHIRSNWMCGKVAPNEKEREGPQLQLLPPVQPHNSSGCGGLPPSVAAGLSSNLNRQWARERFAGGLRDRAVPDFGGPRPPLMILGPAPHRGKGLGGQPNEPASLGPRIQDVRPSWIMAPVHGGPAGSQGTGGPRQASSTGGARMAHSVAAMLRPSKSVGAKVGRPAGPSLPAHATPQSKLVAAPIFDKSRRSTPSSGSAKRKLLEAFELADGPPSPCQLGRIQLEPL